MPYVLPTRAEILEDVKADFRAELGLDPVRRSVEYALSRVQTGQSKGQYGFLKWILRQAMVLDADPEFIFRWAWIFTGTAQKAATPWQGVVRFTGVDTTLVPQGREITREDGKLYTTDEDGTVGDPDTGQVDIACTASEAGEASNCDDLQPLTLVTPLADVDDACTVQSTSIDGTDVEESEDALTRLIAHVHTPARGGGEGDYVKWAREVSGVTRAWEFANLYGPNTVGVAFVRDDDGTGSAILPDAGEIADVQAHLTEKAPITVTVTVITLTALDVPVTLSDLVPNTAAVLAAIETALADFFLREMAPGVTVQLSRFSAAISGATDEESHTLVAPGAAVTSTTAQMPILGAVTST